MGSRKSAGEFWKHVMLCDTARRRFSKTTPQELWSSFQATWHLGKQGTDFELLKFMRRNLCCMYNKMILKIFFFSVNSECILGKKFKRWKGRQKWTIHKEPWGHWDMEENSADVNKMNAELVVGLFLSWENSLCQRPCTF